MNFSFDNFIKGVNDSLDKIAHDQIFDIQGEIFPNIENQAKWHFAKTPTHINLNDGNIIYSFHMPEGHKEEEDFPLVKQTGLSLHDFDKDAASTGTVQVHRSDPGHIYFTIQDGHNNPTYTFKHVEGDNWRAIPKKKHNGHSTVNEHNFLKGVNDKLAEQGILQTLVDTLGKGGYNGGRAAIRGVMDAGDNPLATAGAGLLTGAAYDLGKRKFYNSDDENKTETAAERLRRYILPTAIGGAGGQLLRSTFPTYYDEYPAWRP